MSMTVEQIKGSLTSLSYELIKYVRMIDNSFLFIRATGDHSSMVSAENERGVVSAGTIVIRRDGIRWEGFGSVTLNVTGELCGDDESYLEELFGMKFKCGY